VEVKMPLYPAIKLMDTVMGVDTGGGDTFDFKPELTSEPTAPEAGRIKVFSQVDFNATTEPTGPAPSNGGGDPIRYEFDGDETLILNLYKQDDGQTFDDLVVDPTNPNTGHTPEWSNLRSGDPGLPAVQKDDAFDFTTEPTEPTATATAQTQRLIVVNAGNGGLARSNTGDGGIIIDYTPGPDDNDGFLIINWLAEDHVDPSDPSDGLEPTESLTPSDGFIIADYAEPTAHHPMYPMFDVVGSPTEII
jgi:hypothetical protein